MAETAENRAAPDAALLFDSVFNATNDGVLVVDLQGRLVYHNQPFMTMWRLPSPLAVGPDGDPGLTAALGQIEDPDEFLRTIRRLGAAPEAESDTLIPLKDGRLFEGRSQPQRLRGAVVGRVWWFRDLTDRHRIEQALRQSEERFTHLFLSSPFSILLATYPEGRIVDVNPAFSRLFERERDEVVGRTTNEISLWADTADRERMVAELGAGGSVRGMEFTFTTRDGQPRVVFLSIELVKLRGQWHSLASSIDVTELRRVEDVARRQSVLLEAIMAGTNDVVFLKDLEGRYQLINPAGAKTLGRPLEDVIGFTDAEMLPPDTAATFLLTDQEVIATGEAHLREEPARIDGRDYTFLAQKAPWRDDQGNLIGIVGISRDVTEQKAVEAALRESESRYRTLFEAIGETIYLLSPGGTFLALNPAFEAATGWARGDWLGRSFLELLHPDDQQRARDNVARAEAGEPGTVVDLRVRHATGRWLIAECSVMHAVRQDGRMTGLLGTARDVTIQRQLEEGLRQAQKIEALGTLAGGIAHDFNNILAAIVGHAEYLGERVAGQSDLGAEVVGIRDATTRAKALVRQILTFSRRHPEERDVVALGPVVREALALLRATLPATITISADFEDGNALVLADPTQLHQVIVNLGTNAVHAMQPGGGTLRFDQRVVDAAPAGLSPGRYVRLTVTDTGQGMSPETVRRAFDPFFTTKPPTVGTGLGLAVVHGIMRTHDGEVTLESRAGAGTTATLYFPQVLGPVPGPLQEPGPPVRGRGETVMVVDDEAALVRLGTRMLAGLGYQAQGFTSPDAALAAFLANPDAVDLLFSDLTMPGMTGSELARHMLARRPDLPVVLASGYAGALGAEELGSLGIRDLISKPFDIYQLGETVARCLQRGAS